jgi:phosphoglycerate dehydrogenase-like enzyme
MNILILCPQSEFNAALQKRLLSLGTVVFTKSREEYPVEELIQLGKNADIVAFDPDNIGGFEVTPERLPKLLTAIPTVRGLALSTTAFGYVDLNLCKTKNIMVTNVPRYSSESVAEHVFGLLVGLSKRIFVTDRKTQKGAYELCLGHELKGKTLGVIGLGSIGSRVAELGKAIGMNIIAYNRTPKEQEGVTLVTIDTLLEQADYISLNVAHNQETQGFLSKERIAKTKKGVMIVNCADRILVDEIALAEALTNGHVDSYALEAEDLTKPPLGNNPHAFLFRGFGWYTQEALERNKEIWVANIEGLAHGKPVNPVE